MTTTYKPTVNIPFHMQLRYVDVFPNDPSKDPKGKGYGPSLSLRGEVDGEDVRVYPKGFLDKNLSGMVNAAIIDEPEAGDFDYDPQEKYSIPVEYDDITITLAQPAGEKYARTVFARTGADPVAKVAPPNPLSAALAKKLPGDDEESADLRAHTGRGTQSCEAPSKSALMLTLHGECFKYAYNRLKKANETSSGPDCFFFTGSDVLAYTAQLFIAADRKGVASLAA